MSESTLIAHCGAQKMGFEELSKLPIPEPTRTHQPIPHHRIVEALVETLGFRHIQVQRMEFAATPDGAKMFGLLELEQEFYGCQFAIGLRNANDKSMRLALTVGYRVLICDNMAFRGDFMPVLAKHSKNFSLVDSISIGVDRIQRNFEPLKQSVVEYQSTFLSDQQAKCIIYDAFINGEITAPNRLISKVHQEYFEPSLQDFKDRTLWSLENAFTTSFKELKPFQQYKATARLGKYLNRFYQPF